MIERSSVCVDEEIDDDDDDDEMFETAHIEWHEGESCQSTLRYNESTGNILAPNKREILKCISQTDPRSV